MLLASACAKPAPPPPEVVQRAAGLRSYAAALRVSVSGEELRGRSRALVAFRRPDALRIEIPGPAGARLVAVVRDGRLTAVLPAERAVLEADARADELRALLGLRLEPEQLMDLLVGIAPAEARRYETRWGRDLPRRIEAVLRDGTRVVATVEDAGAGEGLAATAFEPPAHGGFRSISADEARQLLGGR